jgi:hypothetical protein
MIDRPNRCWHDDLMPGRKFVAMDWSARVGCTLLGMIIVDSWLLYVGARDDCGYEAPESSTRSYACS